MIIRLGDLRRIIKEALREGPGIRLIRVGGLSPVKQTNSAAPERKGVWAFIWPYHDVFLLGSTGPEGVHPGEGKTRFDQLKREGWRRFVHRGIIYTRLPVPGAEVVNGWHKTDGSALAAYMTKNFASMTKQIRQMQKQGKLHRNDVNPFKVFSKDQFEVFVPRPDEEGF